MWQDIRGNVMKVSLEVKIIGGKKCLVIPSFYYDIFQPGERYGEFSCTVIARYRVLLIPSILEDQFVVGQQYGIEVHQNPQALQPHDTASHYEK
jgi:hypothetical protein